MVALTYHIRPVGNEAFEANSRCLLIEAGGGTLSILLWDKTRATPEAAEVFSGITSWTGDWELMKQQSELLGYRSLETVVFLNFRRFLPIPAVFYQPSDAEIQLNAFFGEEAYLHTGGDILPDLDMVLAWQVPKDIIECLSADFDKIQFKSIASLVLQNGLVLKNDLVEGHLLVSGKWVWLAVWRNGELLIIKNYPAAEPDNLTYQMLNICRQWGIGVEKIQWKVGGMVNQNSQLWYAAGRFFENFNPDDAGVIFGPDVPSHYFAHQIQFLIKAGGK